LRDHANPATGEHIALVACQRAVAPRAVAPRKSEPRLPGSGRSGVKCEALPCAPGGPACIPLDLPWHHRSGPRMAFALTRPTGLRPSQTRARRVQARSGVPPGLSAEQRAAYEEAMKVRGVRGARTRSVRGLGACPAAGTTLIGIAPSVRRGTRHATATSGRRASACARVDDDTLRPRRRTPSCRPECSRCRRPCSGPRCSSRW